MAITYLLKDTETEYSTAFIDTGSDPSTIIISQYEGQSISKNVSNKTAGQLEGDGYVVITQAAWEEATRHVGDRPTRPN
jgi:hypothetical protein